MTAELEQDDSEGEAKTPALRQDATHYMTPQGHARMRAELHQLLRVERPKVVEVVSWAAGSGDRSENGIICMARSGCARSTGAPAS
jgi:transcription elongation factor GreB